MFCIGLQSFVVALVISVGGILLLVLGTRVQRWFGLFALGGGLLLGAASVAKIGREIDQIGHEQYCTDYQNPDADDAVPPTGSLKTLQRPYLPVSDRRRGIGPSTYQSATAGGG